MPTTKSETQLYTVIKKESEFEIRFYPSVTMAMISVNANTYKDLGSIGFRKLAGFIFGGNEGNEQISMTTPVHMAINDSISSMGFVMPAHYSKETLPKPVNSEIQITVTHDEYVAAIKFGGFATEKRILAYAQKLENLLKLYSVSFNGNFRLLGYNSPYQFFGRKNEIIVSVNWDSK
jgi:hypothetical protein